jgi:Extracellular mutant protein 11
VDEANVLQPHNAFDDTDLDDTIDSGLSTLEREERYVTFTTDYNRPSYELLKTVDVPHYAQQHGGYKLDDNRFPLGKILPDNWQEIVETEKGLQAGFSRPPSVVDDFDDGRQTYLEQDQDYDDREEIESKGQRGENEIAERKHHIDEEQYQHDEQVPEPTPSRTRSNQMPPPPPPPQLKVTSASSTSSGPTSKSSSFVEVSQDETPPIQRAAKKARIELDYDPQVLKTMSYTDLDKQSFDKDPRAPNTTTPVDEHGVPLTLHRKLGNLSRMKEEDVRAMFLTQKDQEWEDTGVWFMGQFETQMRRLMEIRQERRMIAVKFEMEVKRRQAAVAAKTGDVEQELRYLKTGGKDLMDKRVSPMK